MTQHEIDLAMIEGELASCEKSSEAGSPCGDHYIAMLFMAKNKIEECRRLLKAYSKLNNEVEQVLGKALGYPYIYVAWIGKAKAAVSLEYPGAIKTDQVCVGDHVAQSLADEAAERIAKLEHENRTLLARVIELEKDEYYP